MRSNIYIDNVNFLSVLPYIFKKQKLIVLDHINLNFFSSILSKLSRCEIEEANFIAGNLLDKNGESVLISSIRIANKLALNTANDVINNNIKLSDLNLNYGNNTIKLFISKYLQPKIQYFVIRAMVARSINQNVDNKITLYLRNPDIFNSKVIDNEFGDLNIIYYSNFIKKYINFFKYFLIIIARHIKFYVDYLLKSHKLKKLNFDKPSVLSIAEDTIRRNKNLRSHLYWLGDNNNSCNYNNYVINFSNSSVKNEELTDLGTILISPSLFIKALTKCSKNTHLRDLQKQINLLFYKFIFETNFINKNYYLIIYNLFRESKKISSLSIYLNSKIYLFKATHSLYSDAIQLISSRISLKTICVQYSNMSMISPGMMSSADEFILFSDMYEKLFQYKEIKPKKFITFGYLYSGIDQYVKKDAKKIRKALMDLGVSLIVSYFDESVQFDKWGFFTKQRHLNELQQLAKKVINDPTFGVVVKSQFTYSTPSYLYQNDKIIQHAKSTGRFIELGEGFMTEKLAIQDSKISLDYKKQLQKSKRNDIYPTQVALISDFCISHKTGATAGLECALLGKRTLLLNDPPSFNVSDNFYKKSDIVYSSIEELIISLDSFKRGDLSKKRLGDWKDIIHNFDSHIDNKAIFRFRKHIDNFFSKI
tara:strand:- start:4180 stop:6129 length:1950 start_codon:yes stop_codon:yes gene_type:complete